MRSPSPNNQPPDECTTATTGQTGSLVGRAEMTVVPSDTKEPPIIVYRGSPCTDRGRQYATERTRERAALALGERPGREQWMKTRVPQRLIGVDIPDPRQHFLVEQSDFQKFVAGVQPRTQCAGSAREVERVRAELFELSMRSKGIRHLQELNFPELPHVRVFETCPVGEEKGEPNVAIDGIRHRHPAPPISGFRRRIAEEGVTGHPHMPQQHGALGQRTMSLTPCPTTQPRENELPPTLEAEKFFAPDGGAELHSRERANELRRVHRDVANGLPAHGRPQFADNRRHFWEFGHVISQCTKGR